MEPEWLLFCSVGGGAAADAVNTLGFVAKTLIMPTLLRQMLVRMVLALVVLWRLVVLLAVWLVGSLAGVIFVVVCCFCC